MANCNTVWVFIRSFLPLSWDTAVYYTISILILVQFNYCFISSLIIIDGGLTALCIEIQASLTLLLILIGTISNRPIIVGRSNSLLPTVIFNPSQIISLKLVWVTRIFF